MSFTFGRSNVKLEDLVDARSLANERARRAKERAGRHLFAAVKRARVLRTVEDYERLEYLASLIPLMRAAARQPRANVACTVVRRAPRARRPRRTAARRIAGTSDGSRSEPPPHSRVAGGAA